MLSKDSQNFTVTLPCLTIRAIDNTAEELSRINQTLKEISDKMPASDHLFTRGLVIAGVIVSIFRILQAVDIIRNWLGG
jgi:hypothetical protein